jgi:hypothetical protein
VDWCYLGVRGASGPFFLFMWDRRAVTKMEECVGRFSITCSFRSICNDVQWAFVGVYGPNNDNDRRVLWDE